MARVFIDGFESGGLSAWEGNSGCVVATGITGMDGTYCLYNAGNGQFIFKTLPAAAEYYFAFLYRPNSGGLAKNRTIQFRNSTTVLGMLARNSTTGALLAYKGNMATLLGTSTALVALDTTALIEIYYLPHLTNGSFVVKINGVTEINVTGVSTSPATSDIDNFGFITVPGSYGIGYIDNVIVDSANWIGATNIVAVVPTGVGDSTQFTPSTGDNFECVDEVPLSDADYVGVNAVDQVDLYTHGILPGTAYQVKSVQFTVRGVKEGAATPQNLRPVAKVAGTVYPGTSFPLTTAFKDSVVMMELNPATGLPWTVDDVNNAQFGFESQA